MNLNINFNPFPVLDTERLILRDIRVTDKEDMFAFRSDKEAMRFVPRPVAQVVDDVLPLIAVMDENAKANERITWGITEKSTGKLIGTIGYVFINPSNYRGEVGYMLNTAYQRKGYMLEALKAVMDYGFDIINFHSVEAVIHPDNIASCQLVEKYGFSRDAYFKDYNFHNNRFADAVIYSMITPHKEKGS